MPHRVAAIAYDGLCTFEFGIAVEIFGLPRPELDIPWYDFRVCGVDDGPASATGGVSHNITHGIETLAWADTIIVPGWRHGADETVPTGLREAVSTAMGAARGWYPSVRAFSCWPQPGYWTASAPRPIGAMRPG